MTYTEGSFRAKTAQYTVYQQRIESRISLQLLSCICLFPSPMNLYLIHLLCFVSQRIVLLFLKYSLFCSKCSCTRFILLTPGPARPVVGAMAQEGWITANGWTVGSFQSTAIPRFTSLIRSSKLLVKFVKRKLISHYFPTGTTIYLREEGARISENWLVNWKTSINLCISYKRKLVNLLLVYRGITAHGVLNFLLDYRSLMWLDSAPMHWISPDESNDDAYFYQVRNRIDLHIKNAVINLQVGRLIN
jgi:hypothetical protein